MQKSAFESVMSLLPQLRPMLKGASLRVAVSCDQVDADGVLDVVLVEKTLGDQDGDSETASSA